MRIWLLGLTAVVLTGCLPGTIPSISTGNTSTEEAPGTKTNSDQQAPVFNINVYANPTVDAIGGDNDRSQTAPRVEVVEQDTSNGEAAEEDSAPPESTVTETPGSPIVDAQPSAAAPPITGKELLAPLNKGGEPMLVGPVWNGISVDDFNRMVCDMVDSEERVEPVDPVYEGCRAYWTQD